MPGLDERLRSLANELGRQVDTTHVGRSVQERAHKWAHRRRVERIGLAAAVFLSMGAAIFALGSLLPIQEGPPPPTGGAASPQRSVASSSPAGRFFFVATPPEGRPNSLYSINGDGSDLHLIAGDYETTRVSLSPDSTHIVYSKSVSEADGMIVVAAADGGAETVVADLEQPQGPEWSPDGQEIAFFTDTGNIFVVGAGGGEPRRITDSGDRCSDLYPSWSPDGSWLVFPHDCNGGPDEGIYIVSRGDGVVQVLKKGPSLVWPAWSPNGSNIAYVNGGGQPDDGIYLIEPDGRGERLLTPGYGSHLRWSPDGSQVAFIRDHQILVVPAEGGNTIVVPVSEDLLISQLAWGP